jgi:hypothetical protein
MDDDEDIYDDCDFDDDAPEKTDDDMIQELRTSSPSIKNDKISEDPKNILTIYDDDSFSPAGFSPEKPVTDPVTNELSHQSALSDPQTFVCDRIYEDPMNISANYEDDSFSPTGFSPEKPVTDTVQNESPHQSTLSYPQVQHDCDRICEGGGSMIEDPVNNSANYDDTTATTPSAARAKATAARARAQLVQQIKGQREGGRGLGEHERGRQGDC